MPAANVVAEAAKSPPAPPSSTETSPEPALATTRSGSVSALKSPTATELGASPAGKLVGGEKSWACAAGASASRATALSVNKMQSDLVARMRRLMAVSCEFMPDISAPVGKSFGHVVRTVIAHDRAQRLGQIENSLRDIGAPFMVWPPQFGPARFRLAG